MPHFYFHIFDGRDRLDQDGVDLPDVAAARLEAVRLSGLALSEDASRLVRRERWTLDVTDWHGRVVYHVAVHASDRRIPGEPITLLQQGPRAGPSR